MILLITADSNYMSYILACGVGFLYLITPESADYYTRDDIKIQLFIFVKILSNLLDLLTVNFTLNITG
jgi:hypothetical protein